MTEEVANAINRITTARNGCMVVPGIAPDRDQAAMIFSRVLARVGVGARQEFFQEIGPAAREWFARNLPPKDLRFLGFHSCLLCHEMFHYLDFSPTGNFCSDCSADLVFLGHNLNHAARRLRAGLPLGEP